LIGTEGAAAMTRAGQWLRWGYALVGVLALVAVGMVVVHLTSRAPAAGPESSANTPPRLPMLAVKIDNVAEAHPQTGLADADIVYVEPVEGGLTRLLAVYYTQLPPVIGPVRSARASDLGLLPEYGSPALAYSGAAPELLPVLHSSVLVNASPAEAAGAFFREPSRPAPHNLFVHPDLLPHGDVPAEDALPQFGSAPPGGIPATGYTIRYQEAEFGFTWSAGSGRWQLSQDGKTYTTTDSGSLNAATVVEQRVGVRQAGPGEDSAPGSPIAQTVGTGPATVLRDGQRFPGTWSRADDHSPTVFRTPDGQPLPFAEGPVWILLVPR
jgi:hypothetical protein